MKAGVVALVLLVFTSEAAAQTAALSALKARRDELSAQNRDRAALKVALDVITEAEKAFGPEHQETRWAIRGAGQLYDRIGRYADAIRMFEELVRREDASGEKYGEGPGYLANAYQSAGRYTEAEALLRRIEKQKLDQYGPEHAVYLQQLQVRAFFYQRRYMFAAAEELYQQVLRAYEKQGDNTAAMGVYHHLAAFYGLQGARDKARAAVLATARLAEVVYGSKDTTTLPYMLDAAGNLLRQAGFASEADSLEKRAETGFVARMAALRRDRTQHPAMILGVQQSLAGLYHRRGRHDEAIALYREMVPGYEKAYGKDNLMIGAMLRFLAAVLEAKGDLAGARKTYLQALTFYRKQNAEFFVYDVQNQLGYFENLHGRYADAHRYLTQVLPGRDAIWGPRAPATLRTRIDLAIVELALGRTDKAFERLRAAYAVERDNLATLSAAGTEEDNRTYIGEREHHLPLAVTVHEKYLPKKQAPLELGLQTAFVFKGRLLDVSAQTTGLLRSRLRGDQKKLFEELTAARTELARLVLRGSGGADTDEYARAVAELETRVKNLEARLRKASTLFQRSDSPIEVAAIRKKIPSQAALVEIVSYWLLDPKNRAQTHPAYRYGAYVVKATGDVAFVDLGLASGIDDKVRELRIELADSESTEYERVGKELYALTIKKIEPALGGTRRVLLAPDGALNLVPFAALVDERGKFLVETMEFSYLTSGRDLLRQIGPGGGPAPGKPFLFANPAFDAGHADRSGRAEQRRSIDLRAMTWAGLPGTAEEGTAIAKLVPAMVFIQGRDATEGRLKTVISPRILHIATHGFFLDADEEPGDTNGPGENPLLRSGLILAGANKLASGKEDGILTALEASSLDLSGTELVVLSACETGIGKVARGEGVYGLRRALVIAGARAALMSLWKVDDQATRDLMTSYYGKITENVGHSEALRKTQLQMLENELYRHPYHWAGFIPSGHDGPIHLGTTK